MLDYQKGFTAIKIILLTLSGLIIVGGVIVSVIYFYRQPQDVELLGKCGDGMCDDIERGNNLCAQDCKQKEEDSSSDTGMIKIDKSSISDNVDLLYSMYAGYDAMSLQTDDIEKIMKIASDDLGLNYLKLAFNWSTIETQKGSYDWSHIDDIAAAIKSNGLSTVIFYQQEGNPSWARKMVPVEGLDISKCKKGATNLAPKNPEDPANFLYEYIRRYKDDMSIKYLELENEPNSECLWSDTPEYLAEVDNAIYKKIKTAFPDIKICSASFHQPLALSGSLEDENKYTGEFMNRYYKALDKIDCISVHDYGYYGNTQTSNDYKFSSQYDLESNTEKLLSSVGKNDVPIIFTECGYGKSIFGEKLGAAHFIQGYILSHAKGISKGRFCQGIAPGVIGKQGGEDYGVVDISNNEYLDGYYAFKTMRSIMTKYPSRLGHVSGKINDSNYWVEKFGDDNGNEIYVAFVPILFEDSKPITKSTISQAATINIGKNKTATITQMKGSQSTQNSDSFGNINLSVGINPIFIEVKK